MYTWTSEHQQQWKDSLKQLIKQSGQTQADVAREMARRVALLEQTLVSDNAFVTPLSRFVNAKGSEIHRWFELEDERLVPLAEALQLDSVNRLIALREDICTGKTEHPIHVLFPTVLWNLTWKVAGKVISSEASLSVYGTCGFTKALLSLHNSRIEWSENRWSTNVDLPSFLDVKDHILPTLSGVHQQRLSGFPSLIWTRWGFEFGDSLQALHLLLHLDDCWDELHLRSDWSIIWREAWRSVWFDSQLFIEGRLMSLSSNDRICLYEIVEDCVVSGASQTSCHQALTTLEGLELSPTGFDPQWLVALSKGTIRQRQMVIEQLQAWQSQLQPPQILKLLDQLEVCTIDKDQCRLHHPKRWLPLWVTHPLTSLPLEMRYVFLWWQIQYSGWESIRILLETVTEWERMRLLFFLWTEIDPANMQSHQSGIEIGSLSWSRETVTSVWCHCVLSCLSNIPFLSMIGQGQTLLNRLHTLSKRCLPSLDAQMDLDSVPQCTNWPFPISSNPHPLVYWMPFQSVPTSIQEWERKQVCTQFPLWRVLEAYAQRGHAKSIQLLAEGEGTFTAVWLQVPVKVRLDWLSQSTSTSQTFYLFQTMLIEYWQQPSPDLNFVLTIGERIGFDTVLTWMQGWLNPLFLAQHENGQILGEVSLRFAEHFQRLDLIEQWTRMLWNWLSATDAFDDGFVRWNSRRVPIVKDKIPMLLAVAQGLLYQGMELSRQPLLMQTAVLDWEGRDLSLNTVQWKVVQEVLLSWKERLLLEYNPPLIRSWLHRAPMVDRDFERIILEHPPLLDAVWELDVDGQRRSEILRLAGLSKPIPAWSIAFAQRIIQERRYWPTWLSPYAKEAGSLVSLMLEQAKGGHRLWWLKVYTQHFGVETSMWQTLCQWIETDQWKEGRTETVHFLAANQTPKVDFGDILSWMRQLQQRHPSDLLTNPASRFFEKLLVIWQGQWWRFEIGTLIGCYSVLVHQGYETSLWSLDVLTSRWEILNVDTRKVVQKLWLDIPRRDFTTREIDHPIVGGWVLAQMMDSNFDAALVLLRTQIHQGRLRGLSSLLKRPNTEVLWIELLEGFLDEPNRQTSLLTWLWSHPWLLSHPNPIWQQWLQSFFSQVYENSEPHR